MKSYPPSKPAKTQTSLKYPNTASQEFYRNYLTGLGLVSSALILFVWIFNWDSALYWLGGLGLFTCLFSFISGFMTGGFVAIISCPNCQQKFNVMHPKSHRINACPHCDVWLEGAENMKIVSDDYIATYPAFITQMPKEIIWPEGCPVCAKEITRQVKISATDPLGTIVIVTAGIYKVQYMHVPACSEHDNGVGLFLDSQGDVLGFRSYSYMKKFEELNKAV